MGISSVCTHMLDVNSIRTRAYTRSEAADRSNCLLKKSARCCFLYTTVHAHPWMYTLENLIFIAPAQCILWRACERLSVTNKLLTLLLLLIIIIIDILILINIIIITRCHCYTCKDIMTFKKWHLSVTQVSPMPCQWHITPWQAKSSKCHSNECHLQPFVCQGVMCDTLF